MVSSDLIYLIFACFGLATIAENWSEVFVVIRYLGAAYLIYLGYKMFKALISGLMLIAFGAAKLAKTLKTPLAHKRLNQGAGSIMIAAGSYLAISK